MALVLSGTDGVSGVDGTASNPAIEGTDSNTGIFYPAADTVAIGTGGTERLRVDSAGNLGLGVTPSAWASGRPAIEASGFSLQSYSANYLALGQNEYVNSSLQYIYKTSAAASLYTQISGAHAWYTAASGTAGNAITFTQAMTLDASGNFGLGATSISPVGNYRLMEINGTTGGILYMQTNGTRALQLYGGSGEGGLWMMADAPLTFGTNNTEKARILNTGELLLNRTTSYNSGKIVRTDDVNDRVRSMIVVNNNSGSSSRCGYVVNAFGNSWSMEMGSQNANSNALDFVVDVFSSPTIRLSLSPSGVMTCAGIYNNTVGATNRDVFVDNTGKVGYVASIRKAKTNIQDLTDTSWLHQLNPVTFNYRKKDEEGNYTDETDGDIQYGLIAEDVEQVRPDLCFYDEVDGEQELRGIQYSKLVPVMLKEIQKLKAEIEALKGNA